MIVHACTEVSATTRQSAVAPFALGIDLGGAKIETVVLTGDGELIRRQRIPDPSEYAAAIRTIAERAASTDAAAGEACTIGIGTPSRYCPAAGGVRDGNSTYFTGGRYERILSWRCP